MVPQKWTDTQTYRRTDGRTFRLIESIGPEGRCFEKTVKLHSVRALLLFTSRIWTTPHFLIGLSNHCLLPPKSLGASYLTLGKVSDGATLILGIFPNGTMWTHKNTYFPSRKFFSHQKLLPKKFLLCRPLVSRHSNPKFTELQCNLLYTFSTVQGFVNV